MNVMLRLDGCFTNCNCFVGTKLCTSWISFYSCTTHYRFNTTTQHQWSWWKYKETDNQFLYIFYIFYLHISSFIIKTSSFTGEERRRKERMMSRCFTWFPNWLVLGKPNKYQNLVCFTRMWEDCGGVAVVDSVCETCEIMKR